nr:methylated-DNA--[protein]-cysteine S-methyltransferase [Spiractinospora alimapuensis]
MTFRVPEAGPRIYDEVSSPIGTIILVGDGTSLTGLYMESPPADAGEWRHAPGALREVTEQLSAYFAGELRTFTLSLAPEGTEFQRGVWRALTRLPYGQTTSYGELATSLGKPGASRAVGLANGRNPISIVVPCHRVIGADGSLTGYGGGLPRKRHLLTLEGARFRG